MNELSQIKQTMSSREIALLTGKDHKNVFRDIENLNRNYNNLGMLKIENTPYIHSQNGQTYREFKLTKMQTLDLVTGYNAELRITINRRWEELESQNSFKIPQTFSEALELAAKQTKEIEQQQLLIEKQKPKVLFADAVEASKTSILVGELAKIIKQNGINIGQNRLFSWLRDNKYLVSRKGTDYNMPMQRSMDLKLFEIKETSISHSDGHISVSKTAKVTGKGQTYFINKFLETKKV